MPDQRPVIALTGATGFVGRKVLQKLTQKGFRVRALVRPASYRDELLADDVIWVKGVLGDPDNEHALCAGANVIIHMAGLITTRSKSEYERVNSRAVGSLAGHAKTAGCGKFVYLSSLAARAPQLSWYAWSKNQGEKALANEFAVENSVIVRAPAVFGAEDKATAPIYSAVRKGYLPSPGGVGWRKRQLSLIHVDDLADFLVKLCESGQHDGQTVSPSTISKISWPEFAENCQAALGHKVRPLPIPVTVLSLVAAVTTLVKAITGKGHLTLGKLREFLYEDWSVEDDLQSGTDLQAALITTIIAD